MQKIISWNVASVRARLPLLSDFLKQEKPDFVFLQEIKATDDTFPFFDFQIAGYQTLITGQKGYNGVAILSDKPLKNPVYSLAGFEDQARFIQAETDDGVVLISVYVPNGNPPEKDPTDTMRLTYKLKWMEALVQHLEELRAQKKRIILGGDFNVIERDSDVYNPELFRNSALMVPSVREAYGRLYQIGMKQVTRHFNSAENTYSFWDFQGGAWPRNHGILLDAFWVSDDLMLTAIQAPIYKDIRACSGTSDHVPIGLILDR